MSERRGAPAVLDRAEQLIGARLGPGVDLGGSTRSSVWRAAVLDETSLLSSVVIKSFRAPPAPTEFAREVAGLLVLERTPRLLGVDEEQAILVVEDLGPAATLADILLGADADAAWTAARQWARAVGEVCASSAGRVSAFSAELHRIAPGSRGDSWIHDEPRRGAERLTADLGLRTPRGLGDELDGLATLSVDGPSTVVSPGDTCPDNALFTPAGVRLIDLEGAATHHAALDAAYMVLPFATCWCVFDPPPGLTDDLLMHFESGLSTAEAAIITDGWGREVDLACGLWILATTHWLFDGMMAGAERVGPAGVPSPTFRQMGVSRWRWAAEHLGSTLPAVAALAGEAAGWADRHWGDDPLGPYPSFDRPA